MEEKTENKARLTIIHIEDVHPLEDVQKGIVRNILELYDKKRIEAVFCEGVWETDEPIEPKELYSALTSKFKHAIHYLCAYAIKNHMYLPIYGADNEELHELSSINLKKREQLKVKTNQFLDQIDEMTPPDIGNPKAEELERVLEIYEKELPPIIQEKNLLENEIKLADQLRIYNMAFHIVKTSERAGYKDVALTCGRLHRAELKAFSKILNYEYRRVRVDPVFMNALSREELERIADEYVEQLISD